MSGASDRDRRPARSASRAPVTSARGGFAGSVSGLVGSTMTVWDSRPEAPSTYRSPATSHKPNGSTRPVAYVRTSAGLVWGRGDVPEPGFDLFLAGHDRADVVGGVGHVDGLGQAQAGILEEAPEGARRAMLTRSLS